MELMFAEDTDACTLLAYAAHNACFCMASNKPGFGPYKSRQNSRTSHFC